MHGYNGYILCNLRLCDYFYYSFSTVFMNLVGVSSEINMRNFTFCGVSDSLMWINDVQFRDD